MPGMAVMTPCVLQEAINTIGEVARDLRHPGAAGLIGDSRDVDATRPDVDHEEDEVADEAEGRQHLDREEISTGDGAHVGSKKSSPRSVSAALGRWLDSVVEQDALHGVASDIVAEVVQGVAQPGVAPPRGFRTPS